MSNMRDYKIGDRVAHILIGEGTVIAVEGGVRVRFDLTRGRTVDKKPKPVEGFFDRQWFAHAGDYLDKVRPK